MNPKQEILNLILKIRGLEKLLSTYYQSTKDLVEDDQCVHPSFLHTKTSTARPSCINPNLQNQS